MHSPLIIQIDAIPENGYVLTFQMPWSVLAESDAAPAMPDDPIDAGSEDGMMNEVAGELTIQPVGHILRVSGLLATGWQTVCSRCLTEVYLPLKVPLQLEYTRAASDEPLLNEKKEAAGLYLYHDHTLDLREALYEQLVMARPMRVLCRKACKGLCIQCGTDLNQQSCQCTTVRVNNPFAGLKHLKLKKT